MFKIKICCVYLISAFLMVSCGGDDNSSDNENVLPLSIDSNEISETREELRKLDQFSVLDQLFMSTPQQSMRLIDQAIDSAQSGLQILEKNRGTKKDLELAYSSFSTAIYLVDSFNLLQINEARVNRVFNDIRRFKTSLARDLNKPLETWVLYKNNFAGGIEPEFRAPVGKDAFGDMQWATNFQVDTPKAKVAGRDGFAWMVSRSFDLSEVEKPSFRFHASYLVTARDAELTLYEVIQRVFKTYIILDLKPTESLEDLPEDRKIEVSYAANEVPMARNFHDAWLPKRSLEKYKGHDISIGFLFDTREIEYTQYYSWDIYDFEIIGAGDYKISPFIYQPKLSQDLGGFQSLTQVFSGNEWSSGSENVYINSHQTKKTDAVLLSPMIVSEMKPYQNNNRLLLKIEEEAMNFTDPSQAQVLISTDYRVGQPIDFKNQNWKKLRRISLRDLGGLQSFDISSYLGKDFFVAFRFQSEAANESWDINSIVIESESASITSIPFLSMDANDMVDVYKTFDVLNDNYRDYEKIYLADNESPEWKKGKNGVSISAFNGPDSPSLTGASRLITPSVNLNEEMSVVRVRHSIGYIRGEGPLKIQIRKKCKQEESCETWKDVGFPSSTFTRLDDPTFSTWVEIDSQYWGQEVEFSFYYQGQGDNNPNWSLQLLEVASQGSQN